MANVTLGNQAVIASMIKNNGWIISMHRNWPLHRGYLQKKREKKSYRVHYKLYPLHLQDIFQAKQMDKCALIALTMFSSRIVHSDILSAVNSNFSLMLYTICKKLNAYLQHIKCFQCSALAHRTTTEEIICLWLAVSWKPFIEHLMKLASFRSGSILEIVVSFLGPKPSPASADTRNLFVCFFFIRNHSTLC